MQGLPLSCEALLLREGRDLAHKRLPGIEMRMRNTKGEGVAQDSAQAAKWFRKAAEQGQVQAQYNLGVCYHKGKGVAKDHVEAYAFFSLAAERLEQSRKALALLKKDMSSIQVAKGERRANELQSQISAKVSKPAIE